MIQLPPKRAWLGAVLVAWALEASAGSGPFLDLASSCPAREELPVTRPFSPWMHSLFWAGGYQLLDFLPPEIVNPAPWAVVKNDTTPQIGFSYWDESSGVVGSTLSVAVDGVAVTNCVTYPTGATCQSPELTAGFHEITATIRDCAGNLAAISRRFELKIFVPDTTAPEVAFTAPLEIVANDPTPKLSVRFMDVGSDIDLASPVIRVDGHELEGCTIEGTGKAGTASCKSSELEDGQHWAQAFVRDQEDNWGQAELAFEISLPDPDTKPPSLAFVAPKALVRGDATPALALAFSDDGVGVNLATLKVRLQEQPLTDRCQISETGAVCEPQPLTSGTYLADATLADLEGHLAFTRFEFTVDLALGVTITTPAEGLLTRDATVTVTGSTSPGAETVEVSSLVAPVTRGTFTIPGVPLAAGLNTLKAIARTATGGVGTATLSVVRDLEAPRVVIHHPPEGHVSCGPEIQVTGELRDAGSAKSSVPTVTVNGFPARQMNSSFLVERLLLRPGDNVLEAVAVDDAGNKSTHRITVTYAPDAGPKIEAFSGNTQTGVVGQPLARELVARVKDAAGAPLVGRSVTFAVSRGDGKVGAPSKLRRSSVVVTDDQGQARVPFTLGRRAGAGNHEVKATTAGIAGAAVFSSSALPGPPAFIAAIHTPNTAAVRVGAAGSVLDQPLRVQVSDDFGNPVPGVPVRYETSADSGTFGYERTLTTTTNEDGYAGAFWALGPHLGESNNMATVRLPGLKNRWTFFLASGRKQGFEPAAPNTGQNRAVGGPGQRLPLGSRDGRLVGGGEDVTIPMRYVAGAQLTVFANSVTFPDGSRQGRVGFNTLSSDRAQRIAPRGESLPLIFSVEPKGTRFDPPAALRLPNTEGFAPGTVVDSYLFDEDLAQLVSIGPAAVTDDGAYLVTEPGFGMPKASWGGVAGRMAPDTSKLELCRPTSCWKCSDEAGPPVSMGRVLSLQVTGRIVDRPTPTVSRNPGAPEEIVGLTGQPVTLEVRSAVSCAEGCIYEWREEGRSETVVNTRTGPGPLIDVFSITAAAPGRKKFTVTSFCKACKSPERLTQDFVVVGAEPKPNQ